MLTRPAPPPDATLSYGEHPDQVADLRLPRAGGQRRPLVVVIHGGFWRQEYDRSHTGPLAAALADCGWPVAQLEYRRTGSGGGGWTGTFADVAAGLTVLPGLVADAFPELTGAARPPVLLGHSAGGHLALWWAARALVGGVIALAPVTDLAAAYRWDLDGGAVAALLGGGPDEVPHRYAYATPSTAPHRTVVVHGSLDQQVPVVMSRDWSSATGAELRELPEIEHFGLIAPDSPAWSIVIRAVAELASGEQVTNQPPGIDAVDPAG